MTRSTLYRITACLLLLLFSVSPDAITVAAPDSPPQAERMDGLRRPVVLRLDPSTSNFRIPPPASYLQRSPLQVQTATIHVNYLPNGTTDAFGYSCLTWPAGAITAFEYAADIWETLIISTVPIEIDACWTNFGDPNILGIGGADDYHQDFPGAPLANTLYPTALANALSGSRMSGSTVDMHVSYGSTFPWYFGTDGNTPGDKVDLASVVLHEICHGLGFAGSMIVNGGLGYWGWNWYADPAAYDRFAENGAGTALLSYPNGSSALAAQLTSGNLFFDGPNANAANGGQRPKLFAPATWMQGSSYSHLDEIFNGTANDLMTYAIPNGQSMHAPGPIAMGVLHDIGWPSATVNAAPVFSGLPDLSLAPGEARDNAIDLWTFAGDDTDSDADLAFNITNVPPADAGVTIDGDRYIDINPVTGYLGVVPVTVEVIDTGGLTDTDTFTITFAEIVNTAPTLTGIPDLSLTPGEARNNAIDLWAYATDDLDADSVMTYTVTNSPPAAAGITLDSNRYIDISPVAGYTGTVPVTVEVMDTGGLTDTDSFAIVFAEVETYDIYLPLVLRNHGCSTVIPNGGFESGATIWTEYSSHGWDLIINSGFPGTVIPHSGSWATWLGGEYDDVSYIQQQVTVPACAPYLSYYHWIASEDVCGYDFGRVLINSTTADVYTLCEDTNTGGWVKHVVNLSAYAGQSVWLQIRTETDDSLNSNLFIDDVAFQTGATALQTVPLKLDGREVRPRASEPILNRAGSETPVAVERMLP